MRERGYLFKKKGKEKKIMCPFIFCFNPSYFVWRSLVIMSDHHARLFSKVTG